MHILLVDADPVIRQELAELLGRVGHDLDHADNAAEALASVRGRRLDLVIAAADLPGLGGLDLLLALRDSPAAPPVALLSAASDAQTAIGALRRGAVDCLRKPIDADEVYALTERIEAALAPLELSRLPPEHLRLDPAGCDLDAWQRALVINAVKLSRGSPVRASAFLGISRKVLYTLRKRYGLFAGDEQHEE